ncbi:MAG: hypothetical protein JWP44_4537, partial [Mucilaginibacter sp.]|nr:hypothetical protein [Mucilaginibacter sp.]
MMNGPAPDMLSVIGTDTELHRVTGHELAGPCPWCGGTDRFRVNTKTQRFWCRRCSPSEHWSDAFEYLQRKDNLSFAEAKAKLEGAILPPPPPLAPPPPGKGRDHGPVIKTYDYVDEYGEVQYQVCRHDPKDFSQRRPATEQDIQRAKVEKDVYISRDPDGSAWVKNLDGVTRVLYRLPELLARPDVTVFLTEGEKDADTVAGMGLLATTNVGGAGSWQDEYNGWLLSRHVVILQDNDVAGAKRT